MSSRNRPVGNDGPIRLRTLLSYDGTDFHGWAKQERLRTVQGVFESALTHLFGIEIETVCAGRTDTGVHARGQVAHFDMQSSIWSDFLKENDPIRRINRAIPDDLRLISIEIAPIGFDARFSALDRTYTYRFSDGDMGPTPLDRRTVVRWPHRLDESRMQSAANLFLGEHDFVAFCRKREFTSTIRAITRFDWVREADLLTATVTADAFCHSMVRSIMGAMSAVGEERREVEWISSLLTSTTRSGEVPVLPPHGLTLESVRYPDDSQLEARANETRNFREVQ